MFYLFNNRSVHSIIKANDVKSVVLNADLLLKVYVFKTHTTHAVMAYDFRVKLRATMRAIRDIALALQQY